MLRKRLREPNEALDQLSTISEPKLTMGEIIKTPTAGAKNRDQ
ncbi:MULTISPECIES: hypothetical protein [unclassified Mesorhizobium]|nr:MULTISPECIES: hypothetical protein [unclassified Mesorhizobium]